MIVKSLDPPSYWYNVSKYAVGSLCELIRVEECMFTSKLKICGLIHQNMVHNKLVILVLKGK